MNEQRIYLEQPIQIIDNDTNEVLGCADCYIVDSNDVRWYADSLSIWRGRAERIKPVLEVVQGTKKYRTVLYETVGNYQGQG